MAYTLYELLKQGANTQRRHGYCDIGGGINGRDEVFGCTMGGITDADFHDVMATHPGTMNILILNGNQIIKSMVVFLITWRIPAKLIAIYTSCYS